MTMMHRRYFIMTLAAAGLLSACQSGPPKPSAVTINLTGTAGMNPGPDGGDRPVTVLLARLKSVGAFNSADYFALQSGASGALGADLLGIDQVVVGPGGKASKTITFEAEATSLGVIALLRDPTGRTWRTTVGISPGKKITVNVTIGSGGVSASRS
jgi:type VI secretion system protein VasD